MQNISKGPGGACATAQWHNGQSKPAFIHSFIHFRLLDGMTGRKPIHVGKQYRGNGMTSANKQFLYIMHVIKLQSERRVGCAGNCNECVRCPRL